MSENNDYLRSDDQLSQGKDHLPEAVSEQRKSLIEGHNTDEVFIEDNLNLSNSQPHEDTPQIHTTSNTNIQNAKDAEIPQEEKVQDQDNTIPKEQTTQNDLVPQDEMQQNPKPEITSTIIDEKEQIQSVDKKNVTGFSSSSKSQEGQQDKQKQVVNTVDSSQISTKVIKDNNNNQNVEKGQQELNKSMKRKKDNLTLQIQSQLPSREDLEEQNKKLLEELEAMKRIITEKNNRITTLELELAGIKKLNEQKKSIPSYLEGAQLSKKEHQLKRVEELKQVQDKNSEPASFWDIQGKYQPVIQQNSKVNLDQVVAQDTLWINQKERGDIFDKPSIQKDKQVPQQQQSNISIKLEKNNGIPQQMITQDFQDYTPSQKSYSVHEQTPSKSIVASNKINRNQILHQEYNQPQYMQYQQQHSNQKSPLLSQGKQNIIKKGDQYQYQGQQSYQKQPAQYNQGDYQHQQQKPVVKKYYYHEQNEEYQGVNQSQGNGLSSIKKGVLIRQRDDQEYQEEYNNKQKIYQSGKPTLNGRSISNSQLKGTRLSPLKYEVQKRRMS